MDDKIIRRCGFIGAALLVFPILICPFVFILTVDKFPGDTARLFFVLSLLFSPLTGSIGYIMGTIGAKSQNVSHAFLNGGLFLFLVSMTFNIVFFSEMVKKYVLIFILTTLILTSIGSLLGGLSAIVARDYRQFKRIRTIPQFTISEILTVITLAAVVMGSIMSICIIFQTQK